MVTVWDLFNEQGPCVLIGYVGGTKDRDEMVEIKSKVCTLQFMHLLLFFKCQIHSLARACAMTALC
jgi:hypothetical protein